MKLEFGRGRRKAGWDIFDSDGDPDSDGVVRTWIGRGARFVSAVALWAMADKVRLRFGATP